MAAAQVGMSRGEDTGTEGSGYWLSPQEAVSGYEFSVCLPLGGCNTASHFLMCKQLKRGCVSVEDGESKHLLWDLAVSAAAHLRHILQSEFHIRKIAGGIRLLSGWSLKD